MEKLQANIVKIYGKSGVDWLAGLPRSIEQLEHSWKLSELKAFPNLSYSYVLKGMQGDIPVILKLSPDVKLIGKEAIALNAFKGFGAVSVLGCKEGALLLERAVPGDLLKNALPKEKRIEIACKVMEKLHQAPVPSKEGFPPIEEWLAAVDKEWDLPKDHLKRARKLKNKLITKDPGRKVLLHGDLHQENILSSGNSWVVIDPKGVMGCPIHEVWACVENPQQDLKFLSAYFGYPFKDVVEWYYVRLILAACWQAEDGLDAGRFLALAQSVLPMVEP
jgi:streptomycin 6-kinase